MRTEYEVRILNINREEIKAKLANIGAKFEWDAIQKRYIYDFNPKRENEWIRLRTNGLKTTLTIKSIVSSDIDGTNELEIVVDDFDKTNLILNKLGYNYKSCQENRRCQYSLDNVEIDIDSWPMLPDYLEIEGLSEKDVYDIVEKLGFKKEDCTAKGIKSIYFDYGYDLDKIKNLVLESDRK